MNILDFISDSPKTFIFQKGANKTNLGGVLTLLYLIILLLIIVAYLYDYYNHDKYDYSYFYKYLLTESSKEKFRTEEPECNHPINLSLEIFDDHGSFMTYHFTIKYFLKTKYYDLRPFENITLNVADFDDDFLVMINYREDLPFQDLKNNSNFSNYYLIVKYSTKVIDNDNDDTPVVDAFFSYNCSFTLGYYTHLNAIWGIYHYEEKKGIISRVSDSILNKQNQYIFGRIEKIETISFTSSYLPKNNNIFFKINNPLEGIHLYKRSKVSIWDYLANIAALGTTIFNGLCKIFALLYSKNFDNYKIVDNILSKEIKKVKNIELNNNNNNQSNSGLENNLIDKEDLNKHSNSINEDILINDLDNIDEDNIENEDDKIITKLPKLRFFDFFFNNIYSKCCVYIKRQKLIDSCDNILYKYYSIENILYNQILFDNLIKDYHWNNPNLKSIHKNELIKGLNQYVP